MAKDNSNTADSSDSAAIARFLTLYPTIKSREDAFYEKLARLVNCPYCDGKNLHSGENPRMMICLSCNREFSLTVVAGFKYVKKPHAWFTAIYLREQGVYLSSNGLAVLAPIRQSSAWHILRKLDMLTLYAMRDEGDRVPSSDFAKSIGKRSRATPAFCPPSEEQTEMEKQDAKSASGNSAGGGADGSSRADSCEETQEGEASGKEREEAEKSSSQAFRERQDRPGADSLTEKEKIIFNLIPEGESVASDTLLERSGLSSGELASILLMLEMKNLIALQPGDRYARVRDNISNATESRLLLRVLTALAKAFFDFVKRRFHRISRKYLQLYLAAFWSWNNRHRWWGGKLFALFYRSKTVTSDTIDGYVTPLFVKAA